MSKSQPSDFATIYLTDDAATIASKFKKAKTDAEPLPNDIAGLDGRPEADNLVSVYAALSDKSKPEVLAEFGGKGFGVFKPALADLAVAVLAPIAAEMRRLVGDKPEMDRILRDGAGRARVIAEATMKEVREIVGFVR